MIYVNLCFKVYTFTCSVWIKKMLKIRQKIWAQIYGQVITIKKLQFSKYNVKMSLHVLKINYKHLFLTPIRHSTGIERRLDSHSVGQKGQKVSTDSLRVVFNPFTHRMKPFFSSTANVHNSGYSVRNPEVVISIDLIIGFQQSVNIDTSQT